MDKPSIKDALKDNVATTAIGGQAVIEGVMMRGKDMYAMAVRKSDNTIEMVKKDFIPLAKKFKVVKLPILRGVVAFVDSLVMGMKIISLSADIAMDEELHNDAEPTKFEQFLMNTFGEKLNDVFIGFSVVLAIVLSVGLFILTPTLVAGFVKPLIGPHNWALSVIEGLLRIALLVGYMAVISLNKEIQRVFAYHGAEHKTINCFESGDELTVENVLRHTRLHKRCGTSFLLFVMVVSMVVFFFVKTDTAWARFGVRIALVPFIAGISYEIIRWAGRSSSPVVCALSVPGLYLQRLTTKEPDAGQAEVAIAAMKEVLAHEQSDGDA